MKNLELQGQKEDIIESGLSQNARQSSMEESVVLNNCPVSIPKDDYLSPNTRIQSLSLTLHPDLISKDVGLISYWNEVCAENQSIWWLPQTIESLEQDSSLLRKSSNYQVEESSFWKKQFTPTNLISNISSLSLLRSVIPNQRSEVIKGTKKIRVYPRNQVSKELVSELLIQQRRAYNLAIEHFKYFDDKPEERSNQLSKYDLRKIIREQVRNEVSERGSFFMSSGVDEACNSSDDTKRAVISKRKNGQKCSFSFKSRKSPRQSFIVQKLSKGFLDKNFIISESVPEEAFGKITRFVFEQGRWFVCAQKHITTIDRSDIQAKSIVAIDPGVRTFATTYSNNQVVKYGDKFYQDEIFPLLLRIDKLLGLRKKAKNPQWERCYQKKINNLRFKINNKINDLHKKVVYDLVSNYDIILLPSFDTSSMVKKGNRKIRSKTVRSMLGLKHYQFEMMLKWSTRKNGKEVIICNEAYTSKTQSWNGKIINVNSKKVIKEESLSVDRDINGARGIMLRALYGLARLTEDNRDAAVVAL